MVNGKPPGDALLSGEGPSGVTLASPVPKKRGRSRASYKATKMPYSLSHLILQAFENCRTRKGLSLAALKKHLGETGYNVHRQNSRLKRQLNSLVSHGLLTRVSGTSGASGSFRISRQTTKTSKSEPEKKKKAAAVKKSPKMNGQPQKKTQKKKKPPVNKSKNLPGKRTVSSGRKNQLHNHPTGSTRSIPGRRGREENKGVMN